MESSDSIVEKYFGYISTVNLYERDISFYILYGINGYSGERNAGNSKNGILSASQIMSEAKRTTGVKTVLIGITTGILFNGSNSNLYQQSLNVEMKMKMEMRMKIEGFLTGRQVWHFAGSWVTLLGDTIWFSVHLPASRSH